MTAVLQAVGLQKKYQMGDVQVKALRGVDFTVQQGRFVAIMGPSGSGKSTLLHLLGGLDLPSAGTVVLGGHTLTHLSDDEVTIVRRRHVGFIFQFYNLLPTLTAFENVALPLLIDNRSIEQVAARIDELLTLVGLGSRQHHKPDQLSGGEQQRVAIARALVTDPLVILADEPTGNLDSTAGLEILRLLRQACDLKQQSLVMVTHDPMAADFADDMVYLRDGRIVSPPSQQPWPQGDHA